MTMFIQYEGRMVSTEDFLKIKAAKEKTTTDTKKKTTTKK